MNAASAHNTENKRTGTVSPLDSNANFPRPFPSYTAEADNDISKAGVEENYPEGEPEWSRAAWTSLRRRTVGESESSTRAGAGKSSLSRLKVISDSRISALLKESQIT